MKKRFLTWGLAVICVLPLAVTLAACGGSPKGEPEAEIKTDLTTLTGTNMVLTQAEADELLAAARAQVGATSVAVKPMAAGEKYSKADALMILNQIRTNMMNSKYFELEFGAGTMGQHIIVAENGDEYGFNGDHCPGGYYWEINQPDGGAVLYTLTSMDATNGTKSASPEGTRNLKTKIAMCLGSLINELTIEIVKTVEVNANDDLVITLSKSVMDMGANMDEAFSIQHGRIVGGLVTQGDMSGTYTYRYDDDVNQALLTVPANVTWTNRAD